ncbi:Uncharacterised protein [Shigella sonnei]|nr:hypothetical protein EC3234A_114c00010 [Escherichia coli]CSG71938.1 Uncharacterised protein [Shigella sonnei]CSH77287.1 Uncharacterised protein [Shigella sonnei]CSI39323.1 Uncharacterised protein [Shigella sonnei]CSK39348.1 Uncharacterised protein [Shigella sonnei]
MTGIFNVVVRANLHGFVFRVFIRLQRQRRECWCIQHAEAFCAGLITVSLHWSVIHVRQQLPKACIQRPERVEGFITDAGKKPSLDDEDAVFCFWFIFRFARAGRDNNRAIVLSQRLITVVDDRLIAIGFFHCASEVIGDEQLRYAAQEGQATAVGI